MLPTMRAAAYLWNPADEFTVSELHLPDQTILITCPHCAAENEFTHEGEVFEPPKNLDGLDSFTKVIGA